MHLSQICIFASALWLNGALAQRKCRPKPVSSSSAPWESWTQAGATSIASSSQAPYSTGSYPASSLTSYNPSSTSGTPSQSNTYNPSSATTSISSMSTSTTTSNTNVISDSLTSSTTLSSTLPSTLSTSLLITTESSTTTTNIVSDSATLSTTTELSSSTTISSTTSQTSTTTSDSTSEITTTSTTTTTTTSTTTTPFSAPTFYLQAAAVELRTESDEDAFQRSAGKFAKNVFIPDRGSPYDFLYFSELTPADATLYTIDINGNLIDTEDNKIAATYSSSRSDYIYWDFAEYLVDGEEALSCNVAPDAILSCELGIMYQFSICFADEDDYGIFFITASPQGQGDPCRGVTVVAIAPL